jgi:hypothetical protein
MPLSRTIFFVLSLLAGVFSLLKCYWPFLKLFPRLFLNFILFYAFRGVSSSSSVMYKSIYFSICSILANFVISASCFYCKARSLPSKHFLYDSSLEERSISFNFTVFSEYCLSFWRCTSLFSCARDLLVASSSPS